MTLLKLLYALTYSCFPFHLSRSVYLSAPPPWHLGDSLDLYYFLSRRKVADAVGGLCSPLLARLSVRTKAKVKERKRGEKFMRGKE